MLSDNNLIELADRLERAEIQKQGIEPLTKKISSLSGDEAYRIQLINVNKKLKSNRKIVGKKIGLTSLAMQQLFHVDQPDYGHLFDDMLVENGGQVTPNRLVQPKVEAEIAFILKQDLVGPNVTPIDVLLAVDYVVPALEIVDSRIADWDIKLPDTIADNASSGLYVLGDHPTSIKDLDLAQIGMAFYRNGHLVNTGVGAAALGHPALCVAWLANKLSEFNTRLKAGEVVLSGALSAAVEATPADYFYARFAHLGNVAVCF